jgi:hypothetical protein
MMSLDDADASDFTNDHTEAQIVVLGERIAELERRIDGHPDQGLNRRS